MISSEESNINFDAANEYENKGFDSGQMEPVAPDPPDFKAAPRPLLRHPRPNYMPRRGGPMFMRPRMGVPFPHQMGDYPPPRFPPMGPPPFMRGGGPPIHGYRPFPPHNFMCPPMEGDFVDNQMDHNCQNSHIDQITESEDDPNRPPDLMSVRFNNSNNFHPPEDGVRPSFDKPPPFPGSRPMCPPPFDGNGFDTQTHFPPNVMPPQGPPSPMGMPPRSMPPGMMPPQNGAFPPQAMPPGGFPPRAPFRGPLMPPDPSIRSAAVPEPMLPKAVVWVETKLPDGRAYYYNSNTRETTWAKPSSAAVVSQQEVEAKGLPTVLAEAATRGSSTVSAPPTIMAGAQPPKPPEVAVWSEYKTPEGKPYYHNTTSGETVWDKPKVLYDWDSFVATLRSGQMPPLSSEPTAAVTAPVAPVAPAPIQAVPAVPIAASQPTPQNQNTSTSRQNTPGSLENKTPKQIEIAQIKEQEQTPEKVPDKPKPIESKPTSRDPSKPISSTPVSGTPWCVVWTGDRRVFFFNPSQHLSVWDKPEELLNRADVDKLLDHCPADEERPQEVNTNKLSTPILDEKCEEPIMKKQKVSETADPNANIDKSNATPPTNGVVDLTDPTPKKMATNGAPFQPTNFDSTKEALEKAKQEQSKMSPQERETKFREMLVEKEVNAFSIWEKELHKIVFDPRYLLLSTVERRQVFEEFVKEQAEKDRKEKKARSRKLKEDFKELLVSAELHGKSSFSDFCVKYEKDERFKAVDKTRERETYFYDHIDEIRKREKDEQSRDRNKKEKEKKEKDRDKDRKEREEASLRERAKEVKEALSSSLKEREKERNNCLRAEAERNFKAVLVELVKEAAITWSEAKKLLKNDSRWDSISDNIEKDQRREIYEKHQTELLAKHKESFRKLLEENKDRMSPDMPWRTIRKLIKEDTRYDRLANVEAPEDEYRKWLDDRLHVSKQEFLELLKETSMINSKSKRLISDDKYHLDSIKDELRSDRRYKALDHYPEKRTKWLKDFIDQVSS